MCFPELSYSLSFSQVIFASQDSNHLEEELQLLKQEVARRRRERQTQLELVTKGGQEHKKELVSHRSQLPTEKPKMESTREVIFYSSMYMYSNRNVFSTCDV